jgi:Flp pilus assembly pilin Flp
MRKLLTSFLRSEDGAITVDWVVLTALVLGVQIILLLAPTKDALVGVSEGIAGEVTEYGQFLE